MGTAHIAAAATQRRTLCLCDSNLGLSSASEVGKLASVAVARCGGSDFVGTTDTASAPQWQSVEETET